MRKAHLGRLSLVLLAHLYDLEVTVHEHTARKARGKEEFLAAGLDTRVSTQPYPECDHDKVRGGLK